MNELILCFDRSTWKLTLLKIDEIINDAVIEGLIDKGLHEMIQNFIDEKYAELKFMEFPPTACYSEWEYGKIFFKGLHDYIHQVNITLYALPISFKSRYTYFHK